MANHTVPTKMSEQPISSRSVQSSPPSEQSAENSPESENQSANTDSIRRLVAVGRKPLFGR